MRTDAEHLFVPSFFHPSIHPLVRSFNICHTNPEPEPLSYSHDDHRLHPSPSALPRAYQGSFAMALSNSSRSSLLFLFVSRYSAAQRTICGLDGHLGSSLHPSAASHVGSSATATMANPASNKQRKNRTGFIVQPIFLVVQLLVVAFVRFPSKGFVSSSLSSEILNQTLD